MCNANWALTPISLVPNPCCNVAIEFRYAQNINERLSELAADLVRRQVAVVPTP